MKVKLSILTILVPLPTSRVLFFRLANFHGIFICITNYVHMVYMTLFILCSVMVA